MTDKIESFAEAKKRIEKRKYADLVMKIFCDMEHNDKRSMLDRKAEIQIAARERL